VLLLRSMLVEVEVVEEEVDVVEKTTFCSRSGGAGGRL
jgi:hypothetical protein